MILFYNFFIYFMVKHLSAFLMFALCTLGAYAEKYGIEVESDGGIQLFSLDEQPQVTYDANHDLLLSVGGKVQLCVPYSSTMKVRFVAIPDDPSSIVSQGVEPVPTFSLTDGSLHLSGLRPGAKVRVLNVQGQTLDAFSIGDSGHAGVVLPMGVSIVNFDGKSVKVIRK